MKKNLLFVLSLLSCCLLFAQPPRQQPRRDSALFTFEQSRAQLLQAPILRGNSDGATITPVRQQYCFDETIEIDMSFGGLRSVQTCLFINTTDGYMGYTTPSPNGAINMLIPEVESFRLTVVDFKLARVFVYHNQKGRDDQLLHLVSTGNTDAHELQQNNLLTAAPLSKKTEHRSYIEGKLDAYAYKRSDEPSNWFIYGDRLPSTLHVRKFLGLFGVGAISTDQGTFLVMERQNGRNYTVIKRMERTMICFDPTDYKMQEADFFAKRQAGLATEREKIDKDEAAAQRSGTCLAEKMALINFRREQLQKQEQGLQTSRDGNLVTDRPAQAAMIGIMDPLVTVQTSILATRVSICEATEYRNKHPENGAHAQGRINCLNDQLAALQQAESEMRAAETRFAANIAQAFAEKSRIYARVMRSADCN